MQTTTAAALLALVVPAPALAVPSAPVDTFVVAVADPSDPAEIAAVTAAADRLGDVVAVHGETGTVVVRATAARAERLESLDATAAVERDAVFTPAAVPWHLDRLDQAGLPLDGQYRPGGDGAGVTAYVIDSGLRATHVAFTGRVRAGADFSGSGSTDDCLGHGTSVAGALAGRVVGVAPGATVVPLRISGCSGTARGSALIAAVDWAVRDHAAGTPAVLNVSYGGPAFEALDAALRAAVADGITVVVSAGNESADACGVSPAREPLAITVGATGQDDAVTGFSNRGPCVDLLAPGSGVVTAGRASDTAAVSVDGTSFSSPIVAGAAAVLLGANPQLSPQQVAASLSASAWRTSRPLSGTTDKLVRATTAASVTPAPATGSGGGGGGGGGGGADAGATAVVVVGGQELVGDAALASLAGNRGAARITGADSYATSAQISARAFPDGAGHVYLSTGSAFADALGAAAAAAGSGAPVLLVTPDGVPAPVLAELVRLRPSTITATGGARAISDAVLDQVRRATGASVGRASGADRYATARAVALDAIAGSSSPSSTPGTVYLASGEAFPDALSASSAAGRSGAPLLLTQAGALPATTAEQLGTWRPARVVVLGGRSAVSDAVLDQVRSVTGGSVERVSGASRYETAAAVLATGPAPATLWLASGESFPDALSGAAAAAAVGGALVIVPPGGPSGPLADGVRAALAQR